MDKSSAKYHHGNLRLELLQLAEEHLKERGVHQLSLRALAREIGVSQTAPYRHFADKNDLLAALATEGFSMLFEAVPARDNERDASESFLAMGRTYLTFANEHTEIFRLMFGPVLLPRRDYPELFEAGRKAFRQVQHIIEAGVAQGVYAREDIASMAHTAWAGVHGIATLMLDHADSFGYYQDPIVQAEKSLEIMVEGWRSSRLTISGQS